MKLFRFDSSVGRNIDNFASANFVMSSILQTDSKARISCAYLGPNGVAGYHQATTAQLFLVVQGEGWVRGQPADRVPISAGRAAFWEKDEWHESGTDHGMTAIIIEGDGLDPTRFMQAVDET